MRNTHTTQNSSDPLSISKDLYLDQLLTDVIGKYFHAHDLSTLEIYWGIPVTNECIVHNDCIGSPVPAAGFLPKDNKILIHPYLRRDKYKIPLYVIKYLIFHECLHAIYPVNDGEDPHGKELMDQEKYAPNRDKAVKWLKQRNFPVLP